MLNKFIRIIAILLTAVAACIVLPMIFNMFFSPHSEHRDVTYSELLDDFIKSEYEYHNENGKPSVTSVYVDSKGNKYTSAQAEDPKEAKKRAKQLKKQQRTILRPLQRAKRTA